MPAAAALHLRDLQPHELDALLRLYTHLHEHDEPLPDAAIVQATWHDLLALPGHRVFGGYVDDQLVASCTLAVIPNLTRGCRPYGLIENVVTHREHRHRGHGHALLAHALQQAWAAGCYKVMLLTGRQDEATLHFYETAGFDRRGKQAFVARPPSAG